MPTEKEARETVEKYRDIERKQNLALTKISLDKLFEKVKKGEVKELNIIIKADVQALLKL